MYDETRYAYAIGNKLIELTFQEGSLLLLFINNKNKLVTFNAISQTLYQCDYYDGMQIRIRTAVSRLCRKLDNTITIKSKQNLGYILTV